MSEVKDTQGPKVEIAVENFGPIAEANIDLRPLTVFVGPSNTGKTYFATLVYALHGAFSGLFHSNLFSPFQYGVMEILSVLLTGLTTSKGEIQEILNKLNVIDRSFKLSDFSEEIRQKLGISIKDTGFFRQELRDELKNCFDLNAVSELMRLTGEQRNEIKVLLRISERGQEYLNIKMKASESEVSLYNSISLDSPDYDDTVLLPKEWSAYGKLSVDDNRVYIVDFRRPLVPNRFYLPAARSGIMQSHRIIASSLVKRTTRVGLERFPEVPTMSGAIADFMERVILYEEGSVSNDEMKCLAETLESEVLAGRILLKLSPSGYPGFYYRPQGIEEDIRLSEASSMVSELAPLVLFLRGLINPGDTLIIEEPEAHLHPGAQADMAVILARLVQAGVRVIITTHSDWLLQEIGNLMRVGELENAGKRVSELPTSLQKEQVGVWHFQKSGKVEEIPYDRINGVEPMEYLDVAEDLYNRSARLQNRLEETKGDSERA
ncbi:MAG: AAA family ATPase [Candidatus Poribacteria bacterium]|nr:AAA family ATPase [Candidatus Poribacteria bacterium]